MPTSYLVLSAIILITTTTTTGSTIPPRSDLELPSTPTAAWSTEAIMGLCTLFVALICCIAGLAAPKYWQLSSKCSFVPFIFDMPYADLTASTIGVALSDREWGRLDAVEGGDQTDTAAGVHDVA